MSDITLGSSSRELLGSVRKANETLANSANRLASGNRIIDPLDDIRDYYFNKSISFRAERFLDTKDQINKGISSIQASQTGLDTVGNLVDQAEGLLEKAKSTSNKDTRESIASDFNETIDQINDVAEDSSFNGTNLIKKDSKDFTVDFSPLKEGNFRVENRPSDFDSLGITKAKDFSSDDEINKKFEQLRTASERVESNKQSFSNDIGILENRLDFTNNYTDTLLGSVEDNTRTNLIDETARLISARTRNQIATQTFSMISENRNSLLDMFNQ